MQKLFAIICKFHPFIIDIDTIEPIISATNLLSPYKNVHLNLTSCAVTGHQLPIIGTVNNPLRKEKGIYIKIPFLVSQYGPSVHGLKGLISLGPCISFCTNSSDSTLIKDLVFQCSKPVGGMKIHRVLTINWSLGNAFFKPFSSTEKSILTTDASLLGLGTVLEQNGKPFIFIPRQLGKSGLEYSQTRKKALTVLCAVKRLYKYLFSVKFHVATDH